MSNYERGQRGERNPRQIFAEQALFPGTQKIHETQAHLLGLGERYEEFATPLILPAAENANYFQPNPDTPILDFESAQKSKYGLQQGGVYGVRGLLDIDLTRKVRLDTFSANPQTPSARLKLGSIDSPDAVAIIKENSGKPTAWIVQVDNPRTLESHLFHQGMASPTNPRSERKKQGVLDKLPDWAFVAVEGTVQDVSLQKQKIILQTENKKTFPIITGEEVPVVTTQEGKSRKLVQPKDTIMGAAQVVKGELYLHGNTIRSQQEIAACVQADAQIREIVREGIREFNTILQGKDEKLSPAARREDGRQLLAQLRTLPLTDNEGRKIIELGGIVNLQLPKVNPEGPETGYMPVAAPIEVTELPYFVGDTVRDRYVAAIDRYSSKWYQTFPSDEHSHSPLLESTTIEGAQNRLTRIIKEGSPVEGELPPIGVAVNLLRYTIQDGESVAYTAVTEAIGERINQMQQSVTPRIEARILQDLIGELPSFGSPDTIEQLYAVAEACRGYYLPQETGQRTTFQQETRELFKASADAMERTLDDDITTVQTLIPQIGDLKRWQRELEEQGIRLETFDIVVRNVSFAVQGVLWRDSEIKDEKEKIVGKASVPVFSIEHVESAEFPKEHIPEEVPGDETTTKHIDLSIFQPNVEDEATETGNRLGKIRRARELPQDLQWPPENNS